MIGACCCDQNEALASIERDDPSMRSRKIAVVLLTVFALGCMVYFISRGKVERDTSKGPSATTSSSAAASVVDEKSELQTAGSGPKGSLESAKSLTPLDRYVQSTDLLDLVRQLRADADAGDANAARIIAMAYDECFPFAANHRILDLDSISRDRKEPDRSIALSQRTKQLQRCGGLIDTGVIKSDVLRAAEAEAARLDDSVAQISKLAENLSVRRTDGTGPYEMSLEEVALANSIARSRDVEAIVALSYLETYPAYGFAWRLAACDLGRDCGPNGYVMRQQCLYMSQCVAGDYRELVRRKFLAPDEFSVAQAREQEILQAIRRGDVSHLFR